MEFDKVVYTKRISNGKELFFMYKYFTPANNLMENYKVFKLSNNKWDKVETFHFTDNDDLYDWVVNMWHETIIDEEEVQWAMIK